MKVEFDPARAKNRKDFVAKNIAKDSTQAKSPKTRLKINPFTPQDPITDPVKFAGRNDSIQNAIYALFNNKNIMITGERGIGKSSVANQLVYVAQGDMDIINRLSIDIDQSHFAYAIGDHRCEPSNTLVDIVNALAISALTNLHVKWREARRTAEWQFDLKYVKRGQKTESERIQPSELINILFGFIVDIFEAAKQEVNGIVFLIDEIDSLSPSVQIAPFMKALVETLRLRGYQNVSFIIAGVTGTMTDLISQHPSISRSFETLELPTMTNSELREIITNALLGSTVTIKPSVTKKIVDLADGLPQPVQLLGYHSYRLDTNLNIERNDLQCALGFIVNQQKRQEFEDLYRHIPGGLGLETVKVMAIDYKTEMKLNEIAAKSNMRDQDFTGAIKQLVNNGIIVQSDRECYKLRTPIFKEYLRQKLQLSVLG
ncbi:MAG: ATP-binding protein [Candidatus Aquicultor sp.]|nr:ATP-binding protein [Candidatus Aquicultor sp.]